MVAMIKPSKLLRYLTLLWLAGILAVAIPVIRLRMLHLKPFQRLLLGRHLSVKTQKYKLVRVTSVAWQSLKQWRNIKVLIRGVPMRSPPPKREIVTTDPVTDPTRIFKQLSGHLRHDQPQTLKLCVWLLGATPAFWPICRGSGTLFLMVALCQVERFITIVRNFSQNDEYQINFQKCSVTDIL